MRKLLHVHDSDCCTSLGSYQSIDIYWCNNRQHPNLSSVLGRYGSLSHEYASSNPPFAMAGPEEYLWHAAGRYCRSRQRYHRALYRAELYRGMPGCERGPEVWQLYTEHGWDEVARLYVRTEKRYRTTRLQFLQLGAEERAAGAGMSQAYKGPG